MMHNKRRKVGGSGRPRLMSEFLSSAGSTAAASSSSSHTSQIAQPRFSPQPNPSPSPTSQLSQPTVSPQPNPSASQTPRLGIPAVSPEPNPSSSQTPRQGIPAVSPEPNPSSSQTPRLAEPKVSPQPEHTVAAALSSPNSQQQQLISANRSHTKGLDKWNTGHKYALEFDEHFQLVGEFATKFMSQLGILIRDGQRVPLTYVDWPSVDDSIKESIWKEVQDNLLIAPAAFKTVLLKKCNILWKDHKARTKATYFVKQKNDPDLESKVPPKIVPEQWPLLVAYWRSLEAKTISRRNSMNREIHGPPHTIGRKSYPQVRHAMKKTGEPTDKMSVWLKAHNQEDHDVISARIEYQQALDKEPEDQRELTAVKDRIFHQIIGDDTKGYCKTYGSSVPIEYVYSDPAAPSVPTSMEELIHKVTEQVTKKLSDEFNQKQEALSRQWGLKYDDVVNRINELESSQGGTANPQVLADATSGHEKESVGDGLNNNPSDQEPSPTKTT